MVTQIVSSNPVKSTKTSIVPPLLMGSTVYLFFKPITWTANTMWQNTLMYLDMTFKCKSKHWSSFPKATQSCTRTIEVLFYTCLSFAWISTVVKPTLCYRVTADIHISCSLLLSLLKISLGLFSKPRDDGRLKLPSPSHPSLEFIFPQCSTRGSVPAHWHDQRKCSACLRNLRPSSAANHRHHCYHHQM